MLVNDKLQVSVIIVIILFSFEMKKRLKIAKRYNVSGLPRSVRVSSDGVGFSPAAGM